VIRSQSACTNRSICLYVIDQGADESTRFPG